jgi:uncharacterized membrane protein
MSKKKRRSGKRRAGNKPEATAPRTEPRATESRDKVTHSRSAHPLDNWLLGLVLAGIALTTYLTFVAWFGERPAFCGADSSCDLVQQSRWSTFLSFPMAFWGLLTYAVLARLLWRLRTRPSSWPLALTVAFVGAAVSWYLIRRPAHMAEHAWAKSLPVPAGAALLVVLFLFMHFGGFFNPASGPEKPYLKALATHLRDIDARFYGAYWCPTCQDQKKVFEASAHRLPYVECSPEGRTGAANFTCVANDVKDYPTWVINGERHIGLVSVDRLATLSRFKWSGDATPEQ